MEHQTAKNIRLVKTAKNLASINAIIVIYFICIYVFNWAKIDHVLIGIFRELLTIPFLLAQLIFLIVGVGFAHKNKGLIYLNISLMALAVCTAITIGSFF